MDVRTFCTQSHVLIVAGKGGVGKTTMVAAIARMAADAGLSVLVIELEGRSGVSDAFGHDDVLDYAGAVLSAAGADQYEEGADPERDRAATLAPGSVQARRITPDDALIEYLADHGLRRISKRLMSSGIIDIVSGAIPGIRDILVLGKVKQIEQAGLADLVLVDAPATGHTMTFLSSASGLVDAARGGPVRAQAADVVALLTDPARCQVALVTLPEEMPVNEVVEAAYQLEDKVGITLGPIIVNGCYPPVPGLDVPAAEAAELAGVTLDDDSRRALDAAGAFRRTREALQQEQIERLAHELPLPELRVPFAFTASIGPEELQVLADALGAGIAALPDVEAAVP
ncbi:MAG TPA: ArsA-related P-loop ATPase [Acidimicrobiales bacterium]|nr:ArsA-related P-loop ATPase [Acidimicrobiales bacterium]